MCTIELAAGFSQVILPQLYLIYDPNNRQHQAQQEQHRSCACPHQLTYKSILLAKAETKFLGTDLDENIQSLIDQIRLSAVSVSECLCVCVHLDEVCVVFECFPIEKYNT